MNQAIVDFGLPEATKEATEAERLRTMGFGSLISKYAFLRQLKRRRAMKSVSARRR